MLPAAAHTMHADVSPATASKSAAPAGAAAAGRTFENACVHVFKNKTRTNACRAAAGANSRQFLPSHSTGANHAHHVLLSKLVIQLDKCINMFSDSTKLPVQSRE